MQLVLIKHNITFAVKKLTVKFQLFVQNNVDSFPVKLRPKCKTTVLDGFTNFQKSRLGHGDFGELRVFVVRYRDSP